ncbi:MAG: hypothetical protein AAF414_09385 [Pseudomonadota bacterium]
MGETYEVALGDAASKLERARELLMAEIADYPTPISGCDAQFNRLLSDRARVSNAIKALKDMPFVPTPRALERGVRLESR